MKAFPMFPLKLNGLKSMDMGIILKMCGADRAGQCLAVQLRVV